VTVPSRWFEKVVFHGIFENDLPGTAASALWMMPPLRSAQGLLARARRPRAIVEVEPRSERDAPRQDTRRISRREGELDRHPLA
jgi:hypothetical protein